MIETLERICETVDSISLNDPRAWESICRDLSGVEKRAQDQDRMPLLADVCRRTAAIFARVGGKTAENPLAAVDAAVQALSLAVSYLQSGAEDDAPLTEALALLEGVSGGTDAEGPADAPTLDEAAALMIQIEPGDPEGQRALKERLDRIAAGADVEQSIREPIEEAADRMAGIVSGTDPDPAAGLDQVGRLIEAAVKAKELAAAGGGADPASAAAPSASAPDGNDYMPEDPDNELIAEFIAEGSDLIEKAEESLLTLETDPDDMEAVATVFRAFHTIKGNAAFLELTLLADMGHRAESLLSRVRDKEIRYAGGYADLALRALDMLKSLIEAVQEALNGASMLKPAHYDELLSLLENPENHGISEESEEDGAPRVGDLLVAQGAVEREALEAAVAEHPDKPVGVGVVRANAASASDVGRALRSQSRMRGTHQAMASSVRVTTSRLDRMIDMVGELVIAHSMVAQDEVVINGNNYDLLKKVSHTAKIIRELQDLSMSMRMVPLKATFNKMTRLVRDLARKVGKAVHLETEGEDTEIDRNLVDIINDPLVHMVRNAVDHGIETPEQREAAGKPPSGTVSLCAYHSAGNVVVEIRDDGRGLDKDGILEKARQRGLIAEGAVIHDKDAYNLIFEPGFSTAQEVTDVSGRGVGMDVVKRNIESLRGQVEIQSTPGAGSVFKMSLPLTLAIIDGMVVRVGKERYVIPTVSIIRSIKPEDGEMSSVLHRGEMLSSQGKLIPVFRLAELYDLQTAGADQEQNLVVVIEDEGDQAGVLIDELIGRQQVVIKSLGGSMQNIPGISGGAIMPNGRVGLILDVGGVVKLAHTDAGRA